MLIFVYGTLKRGYGNHRHYLADAKFVGEATTVKRYGMVGCGVPFVVDATSYSAPIAGEVFEFDPGRDFKNLQNLDRLESAYRRVKEQVKLANGKTVMASYYVGRWQPSGEELKAGFNRFVQRNNTLAWSYNAAR